MKYIQTFEEFIKKVNQEEGIKEERERAMTLAGIKKGDTPLKQYAIQITIEEPTDSEILLEHETYKRFQKTNNRYIYHPENTSIPVKAHYHIYPSKGKEELYAVNVDGTAHHKKNKGHTVPKKEADELRKIGVTIPPSNIIESVQWTVNENVYGTMDNLTIIIIIDKE